jgi:hypothetical protein
MKSEKDLKKMENNSKFEDLWEDFRIENPNSIKNSRDQYLSFKWLYEKLVGKSYNTDEYLISGKSRERLINEYKKYGSLTIGFDFDGTVHDYHKTGATYEQVRQLLRDLKEIGCVLICWTAYKDLGFVEEFLKQNNIPFDGINTDGIKLPWESKKPFFSALLDDRAGLLDVYNDLRYLVDQITFEKD